MKTIPPHLDPLGNAVKEYHITGNSSDILVESDIAEISVIASSYYYRQEENLPSLEKMALTLCKGEILDIGAGAGCHSIILQSKGFQVTALDHSELCCDIMGSRGIKNVVLSDYYEYPGSDYDTLILLMNGIGIAGTMDELPKFLTKAGKLLKAGGQIIFDSSDIDYMYYEEDGSKLINLNSRYYGELMFRMVYKDIEGEPFPWLYIDYQTLSRIVKKFGFEPELVASGEHHDYLACLHKIQ
jgi:SAM-dependent methyltransferase